jgi:hypothetical protein
MEKSVSEKECNGRLADENEGARKMIRKRKSSKWMNNE